MGIKSRTISSTSIGGRFKGLRSPLTRTIGAVPTFRCKSLPSSFTQALKSLSTSSSCLVTKREAASSSEEEALGGAERGASEMDMAIWDKGVR